MLHETGGLRRFDANTSLHHHFRCLRCQKLVDFDCEYYNQITIPKEIRDRFKVINQRILLEGICDGCNKA